MAGSADLYECPFCQFKVGEQYAIFLHVEALHTDDSPFVVRDENGDKDLSTIPFNRLSSEFEVPDEEETTYVLCSEDDCGENILLMELQTHQDFHFAERISMEDARSQTPVSGYESADSSKSLVLSEKGKSRHDYHGRSEGGGSSSSSRERRDNKTLLASRGKDRNGNSIFFVHEPAPSPVPSPPSDLVLAGNSSQGKLPKKSYRSGFGSVFPAKEAKRRDKEKERLAERLAERPIERPPHRTAPARAAPTKYGNGIHGVKRLGISDLGPYAHEAQMPACLRRELELGGKLTRERRLDPETGIVQKVEFVANETPDLIPVIALLCERDANIARAWVCHPGVKHVGKQIRGEGGFCGYRNIQMMISYVQDAFPRGTHPFEGRIPTILRLQDWIEEGWDKGINANARLETGGIKGTRKYIGTSEAQTMFISLGIPCRPFTFTRSEGHQTQYRLLEFVERYFQSGSASPPGMPPPKVLCTQKPPIYFQHSGHSMTIVGCETAIDGSKNLLVYDPFFTPSAPMKKLSSQRILKKRIDCELLLRAHRRGMGYLQKYKEFEVIVLEV